MMYLDWEKYSSWFTSYEMDADYIKYFEEISKKIKVCIPRRSYEGLESAIFLIFMGCQ
jgi:hypothetical protein